MKDYGRTADERRAYKRLFYPGTDTLINKLGIRDRDRLEMVERYHAQENLRRGLPPEAQLSTAAALQVIHRTLLHSVYGWAGQFRTYTTGRGIAFARPEYIQPALNEIFARFHDQQRLYGLDHEAFAASAAFYVNEINAVHPFIEGNGRVQRVWLRIMADQASLPVRLSSADRESWYHASKAGFHGDHNPMAALILARIAET